MAKSEEGITFKRFEAYVVVVVLARLLGAVDIAGAIADALPGGIRWSCWLA